MPRPLPTLTPENSTFAAATGATPLGERVRTDGKFFRLGNRRFPILGFSYGPFAGAEAQPWPSTHQLASDLGMMAAAGASVVRVYAVPPPHVLDAAAYTGLRFLVDVPWPKNLAFCDSAAVRSEARQAVLDAACTAGRHPATFALCVGNEIPPDIVRYAGPRRTERFIDDLIARARSAAPECLLAYGNFPSTEYLRLREADFALFNVYLHDPAAFADYLAHLQSVVGDVPLVLGEYGIDTQREVDEQTQAQQLEQHLRLADAEGCAGTIVFSFTDDWHAHGHAITDWSFGVTREDRSPKPAFHSVSRAFAKARGASLPEGDTQRPLPAASVLVCTYNGAATLESCLRSLEKLDYPDCETIVVDDGSTDATPQILARFPTVRTIRLDHTGLSAARNAGLRAAGGDIVAYTDDDCDVDPAWLTRLVLAITRFDLAGAGGPNLVPDEGDPVAACVAHAPGGPTHVMIDDRIAEHVPGCNMAFRRDAALAIGGFDGQFRTAGDDVDFIWRLQDVGGHIGFAPAAQVWHYRRNTVGAYLKQQRGYGRAEGMLRRKHPHRFNALGAPVWQGGVYGARGRERFGLAPGGDRIYHGRWGSALFQSIYAQPGSITVALLTSLEWHLLSVLIATSGVWWHWSLLAFAGGMQALTLALSITAAARQPRPRPSRWWSRMLIAYLHWHQPIARGSARYWAWLTRRGQRPGAARTSIHLGTRSLPAESGITQPHAPGNADARTDLAGAASRVPLEGAPQTERRAVPGSGRDSLVPRSLTRPLADRPGAHAYWWSHGTAPAEKDHRDILARLHTDAKAVRLRVDADDGWRPWDLRLGDQDGLWRLELIGATEQHRDGRLAKFHLTPRPTGLNLLLTLLAGVAATAASLVDRQAGLLVWIIVLALLVALAGAGGLLRWRVGRLIRSTAQREGFLHLPSSHRSTP